jgi:hypothetical protein
MSNDKNSNASPWRNEARAEPDEFRGNALNPGSGGRSSTPIGKGRQRALDSTGSDPNNQNHIGPAASLLHSDDNFGKRDTLMDRARGDDQGFGQSQSTIDEFGVGPRAPDGDVDV